MDDKLIDIVQRLRYQHVSVDINGSWLAADDALATAKEGADEIEDLREQLINALAVIDDLENDLGIPQGQIRSVEPSA